MSKQFKASDRPNVSRRSFLNASLIGAAALPANLLVADTVHAAEKSAAVLTPERAAGYASGSHELKRFLVESGFAIT